jgi:hypothetical protein
MKHLLDIKYFLTEALTPEFQNKYRPHAENRSPEVQARLNEILGDKERVYIPYTSNTISGTQKKVNVYLRKVGYKIMDYKLNQAVQIENNKRVIRISKLLAKNPELLKEFTLDDIRANARVGSEFSIVLTSNYEDVAGMSFCRDWDSCMDIESGSNKRYITNDIIQGTIIAYLIKSTDLEIEEPLGRVNIKPYYSLSDENEVLYVTDKQVYGNVPDEKLFIEKVTEYIISRQDVNIPGFYHKMEGLYSDYGSPESFLIDDTFDICYDCSVDKEGYDRRGYDKEGYDRDGYDRQGYNKEGYDRQNCDRYGTNRITGDYPHSKYLTKEQYRFVFGKTNAGHDGIDVDENGVVNIVGDVDITYLNLDEIPIKYGMVTGSFYCSNNNLINLNNSPDSVGGTFDCTNNYLTTLIGGPVEVGIRPTGGTFDCSNNFLTSLEGAPKKVRGYFECARQAKGIRFTREEVREVCEVGGAIYC